MKKNIYLILCVILLITYSCEKPTVESPTLNIAAINNNTSQIVNVELKSLSKKTTSIDCHVLSSTTFNIKNKTFGYLDCSSVYRIININTSVEVQQIQLPVFINLVIVDPVRNMLVGHYFEGMDFDNGTDYVITIDLNTGVVVSDNPFEVSSSWNATTYFFRETENEYVLLRYDNVLTFINPTTGKTIREINLETYLNNGVYDKKNNRLIGMAYSFETEKNYIVTLDLNTGNILSNVIAEGSNNFVAGEMDYDAETNSYILVSSNYEILFFDVATGKIKDSYQLDFNLSSLKFWRNNK
jgi:hypothetical protein